MKKTLYSLILSAVSIPLIAMANPTIQSGSGTAGSAGQSGSAGTAGQSGSAGQSGTTGQSGQSDTMGNSGSTSGKSSKHKNKKGKADTSGGAATDQSAPK